MRTSPSTFRKHSFQNHERKTIHRQREENVILVYKSGVARAWGRRLVPTDRLRELTGKTILVWMAMNK